jgi:hypothetical protein
VRYQSIFRRLFRARGLATASPRLLKHILERDLWTSIGQIRNLPW